MEDDYLALIDELIDDSEIELAVFELEGQYSPIQNRARRTYVRRDFVQEFNRFYEDYFADDSRYSEVKFSRRYRMPKTMFLQIVNDLQQNNEFFKQKPDATGKLGLSPYQKCGAAVKLLATGITNDSVDEYFKIGESTALYCVQQFCTTVIQLYGEHFLRLPNSDDIERIQRENENRGFPGLVGSIDCMHWEWVNCPTAYKGQYQGKEGRATVVLEAIASKDTHIWHSFFGCPGSLNDINILERSPLLNSLIDSKILNFRYTLNGKEKEQGYLLADGIYPDWEIFIKTISHPTTAKEKLFAKQQEAVRKDVERAFGILKKCWHVLAYPARFSNVEMMEKVIKTCIILHNMRIEFRADNELLFTDNENVVDTDGFVPDQSDFAAFCAQRSKLRNSENLKVLRKDIIDHLWNHFGER